MDERGFTLVELLVVVLIIGVLAAIAIPVFTGKRATAYDASAKQDVRNAVSQMESCFRSDELYHGCPDLIEHKVADGVVVAVTPDGLGYTVSQASKTGTSFSIQRSGAQYIRSCTVVGGGCRAGNVW